MSKTLFIENSPFLTRLTISDELKESISIKQGKNNTLIVKNIPGTILNRTNQNGRIYSTAEIQKALDAAKQQIATKQLLCSCDEHPEGSFVSPSHAAFVIIGAYIKKNVKLEVEGEKGTWDMLFCDIEVLNTSEGKNLQALLLSGCSLGTSIRGLGDMDGDQVVNYEFLGFDIVSNPSSGTFTNMPIYEAKIESIEENALNEATKFTVSTYASNTTHDLEQAMQFQNKASQSLNYGTITNMNTKMDQEVDPKTGIEKTVGEVEVETSDDTSDLKTALEIAGRAFTNPENINVTSITIEKVDEDDMKDSVQTDEAVLKEEDPTAGNALYNLWKDVYGDRTLTVKTAGPDVGVFPSYDGTAICYGLLDGHGGVMGIEDSVPYVEGDSLTVKVGEAIDKAHEAYGFESDLYDSTNEENNKEEVLTEAPLWSTMAKFKDWGHSAAQGIKNAFHNYQTNVKPEEIWDATMKGKVNFLKGCIDHGVDLNVKQNGINPLMYAATRGTEEVIDVLAKDKNLLNSKNIDGNTPLILAAAYGRDPAKVDVLLRNGADIDAKNKNGKTVYDYAQNNPEMLNVLQKYKEAPQNSEIPTNSEMPKVDANAEELKPAEQPTNDNKDEYKKNVEKLKNMDNNNNSSSSADSKVQEYATNRLKLIGRLIKSGLLNVDAKDPDTGYSLLDYAMLHQDTGLTTLIQDFGGKNSKKFKSDLKAAKQAPNTNAESIEDSEEVLTEQELAQGMWIKTELLDPTAVYYVDEVTDDGVYLCKNSTNRRARFFIKTDGSYVFPWEEVKDEAGNVDISEPLPEATQLKENEKWVLAIDCADGVAYVQDLRDNDEYASDWDITEDENMAVVFDSEEAANEFKNQFIMQGENEEKLPTLNMFYAKKLENIEEAATDGTISQNDKTLTIDVDGNEIEKDFRTPEEARVAKAGLENGELTADVMYNEASSWWVLKIEAGDFKNWYVQDSDPIDVTADENQAKIFPTEEEAKQFQIANNCEEYEYENGLRSNVVPVQIGITDDDIFGKQEEANMDEKLYANEDPASDSFEEKPVEQEIANEVKDIKVTLGEIVYDIDENSDFDGDPDEVANLLEAHLPETIEIELNGTNVPEEDAEQFIYEEACKQTGLPIKNATILNVEEIEKEDVKEEDIDMDATTDLNTDEMSGLEGTSGAFDLDNDMPIEEDIHVGGKKKATKPIDQVGPLFDALKELDIDPVFATKRPLHGRLGQVWRIQKVLPANPNSLDPEERDVRFRLKPFYMDADEDTKVMDRLDLTADQLKSWVNREKNRNSEPVDQVDIANNRKTSALANRANPNAEEHKASIPHMDVLGNVATHGINYNYRRKHMTNAEKGTN